MIPLIGLIGQKQSGKDTLAGFLVERHGFERFAFADALKAAALRTDPMIPMGGGYPWPLSDVVESFGWEGAKKYPEVRRYLQEFGVAIRALEDDFWLRRVIVPAEQLARQGYPVVITDCRFPNEIEAVREAGGYICRVERPGLPDDDRHESENAWRGARVDFIVKNEVSREELAASADFLAAWIGESRVRAIGVTADC